MVYIPSGTLNMGGDNEQASEDEYPKHSTKIDGFYMDETEVTNAAFKEFIDETGYVTIAERPPDSLLQPGALVFHQTSQPVALDDPSKWWSWTIGASWQHPLGPDSDIKDKMDHPVVQISWEDAAAYAKWADKRLPTEAEWEWAARGGKEDQIYPWGNESVSEVGHKNANYWQGMFPFENSEKDGYLTTAPVKSFPPNAYGLYDMAGNVWEWCQDWYDANYYQKDEAASNGTDGPGQSYNPMNPYQASKVMRGGSFLCNDDYCSGYRNARRMQSSPDTGLNHAGFRCVKDK
ncbi:UNVERIFIED_CONTAM: hypothetical protein GTU68_030393 [Idotea baltica]|nr:hypothetical protein [Idotea baltica]